MEPATFAWAIPPDKTGRIIAAPDPFAGWVLRPDGGNVARPTTARPNLLDKKSSSG